MNEKFLSKYALKEAFNSLTECFAFADKNFKINYFSKGFKVFLNRRKVKNISFIKLFNLNLPENLVIERKKTFPVLFGGNIEQLEVVPLKDGKKIEGYFLQIIMEPLKVKNTEDTFIEKENTSSFPEELQQILLLLAKEDSIEKISMKILQRCLSLSNSSYAVLALYNDKDENNYFFYDPESVIDNIDEAKKSINENISFITKWISINKKSLIIENSSNNIGYNLLRSLECKSLMITPCSFDNKLLAAIILAKKENDSPLRNINSVEQFAALLSFAINSITTRELNAALESRLLQAQKLETIGKLSSGMAHDFSNLLSSIFGSINLLKKRVPEKEDTIRLLDNIENCAIRASDLTKGLLSFGKPTPKRKELIKPIILLNEISKVITQTFPAKIIFEKNIEDNLYDILGNGTEVYQVLLNLCVNAKEAIDGQGKISLSAKNITIDRTNNSKHPFLDPGNYVMFSISDNGTGIEEENLQKIFDPYFSTKDKGSGLGLYVTYGIIKAHKGHIEVSSELGNGTTFDVFIPSYEPTKITKPSVTEKIILLADDELMLRDLLAEMLESYGYNVIKVVTGFEVLKVLTEEIKVDLAIIDFNMPELDGLTCIRKIRELKFNIPIILSTGSTLSGETFDELKEGINSIVPKPYEFDTMLSTIQKLI